MKTIINDHLNGVNTSTLEWRLALDTLTVVVLPE